MICEIMAGDNRFEIIAKAKEAILESTNIETSEDEMKVLDNILFRCWQMGWLDKYDDRKPKTEDWIRIEERKPKHYQDVIITHKWNANEDSNREVAGVFYDKVNDRFYDQGYGEMSFSDVVAWMPMPTPYDK